ncbi:augmin complex subunit dgt3 [Bicyclus anynana]|uniref:Augmin complex subunit dgt3 n=1 Tax=Bicyclus anynana TaxID=110368 RepID=A0A6J1MM36_BICAN|nr:augmin complex subunit dgt3 [Bicyclus anynana]
MHELNTISDEEFIPFLQKLGVETYNKSFEWLLGDPDFAGVLGWIYNNLDHNNALTAREEYRYTELEKQGKVLSSQELEAQLQDIQDEFKGLSLPGDEDGLEDIKLDIRLQKEKLAMLNHQEEMLMKLMQQNEAMNQELAVELTKLNAAQKQAADDERLMGEECVKLARQVEATVEDITDTVADALSVYGSCAVDKELAKRFFTYGPFESYKQTQELFKSHFDLFTSLKFDSKRNNASDDDVKLAVREARNMEDRLSDAVSAYIESKAELSGAQAKLLLILHYDSGHQYAVSSQEAHSSAIQLLEQEESILEQQIQNASKRLVQRRTALTVDRIAGSALADREQTYKQLVFLQEVSTEAVSLERLLYCALRRELVCAEELLHFASHLRTYLLQEADCVADRIKSMNDTCTEQTQAEVNLQDSDVLLKCLISTLGGEPSSDAMLPIKLYNDMRRNIRELKDEIQYGYRMKKAALEDIKVLALPLRRYIYDGCTGRPNCRDRSVAALTHALTHEMASVDARVLGIGETFTTVKGKDVHNTRKLWQWFLTDPAKLAAAMKYVSRD